MAANNFPVASMELIEADILKTLPSLHIFLPGTGPLYEDLKDMLCAWVVARSDEGLGYVSGVSRIAGMLLLQMPAPQAFTLMRNLLERHCLRCFYGGSSAQDDVSNLIRHLLLSGLKRFRRLKHTIGELQTFEDVPCTHSQGRIFDTLLADGMPKSKFHESLGINRLMHMYSILQLQATSDIARLLPTRLDVRISHTHTYSTRLSFC
jgi:hypothetical protein